jgi:hypothetical protein
VTCQMVGCELTTTTPQEMTFILGEDSVVLLFHVCEGHLFFAKMWLERFLKEIK